MLSCRQLTGRTAGFGRQQHPVRFGVAAERTVEQPQPEFDPQNSRTARSTSAAGQAFFTDGLFEGRQVEVRRHLHIHAGSQRLDGRLGAVGRYAVLLQFGSRRSSR